MATTIVLSVIIPAYNEEKRLPHTLKSIAGFLQKQSYSSEIIIVDDGSTDQTRRLAADFCQKPATAPLKQKRLLIHQLNQGKGAAVKTGIMAAIGQRLLFTDADNSTPITEINKLLPELDQSEVVIGSRHLPESDIRVNQPFYRRFVGQLGNKLIQILLLPGLKDTQCGFKLFRSYAAKNIFQSATINRWGFDIEVLFIAKKHNYIIKEMPVIWENVQDSTLRPFSDILRTLKELIQISLNSLTGKYNPASKPKETRQFPNEPTDSDKIN